MKIVLRLVLLAVVAAIVFWLWTIFFPSPEKVILQKIASLATTATFGPADGNLTRANKVSNLIGYFSTDAEISIDAPELGSRTLSGRDEIRDLARSGAAGLAALDVQFLDVSVRLGAGKTTADVSCTGRVNAGDKKDYVVMELHFQLKKIDGDWLITRVQTVKTLS
jgi:hypothetical protein